MADGNGISLRRFNNNRPLFDSSYGKDSNLWLVDDRCAHDTSERSDVSKRERSASCIIRSKFIISRGIGESIYLFGKSDQVQLIGIPDHRYNQVARWKGCSHSYINIFFYNQLIPLDARIQPGIFLNAFHYRFNE